MISRCPDEEMFQIISQFDKMDLDANGFITKDELSQMFRNIGYPDGLVPLLTSEFVSLLWIGTNFGPEPVICVFCIQFEQFDINGDGKVSKLEMITTWENEKMENEVQGEDFEDHSGTVCFVNQETICESVEAPNRENALEEPVVPFKKLLDIKESSATAIDVLNESILSCVWLGLSKNTYGKFVNDFTEDNFRCLKNFAHICRQE